ncbi:MAG TPA: hypothetical protein VEL07_19820 [Planctomycetota bacterium]|nr:hypothetical protein [Planctomycetota bacterium]
MTRPNMGLRGGNGSASLIDRLTRVEMAVAQIPSRFGRAPAAAINDQRTVAQSGHGFAVGKPVYWTGAAWALANWTREKVGVVVAVIDANAFEVATWGQVDISGLTPQTTYYMTAVDGAMTASPVSPSPTTRALLFAIDATTALLFGPVQNEWMTNTIGNCRDVEISGLATGDILYWNTLGHGCWNNGPAPVALTNDSVTDAFLRNSVGLSVIGRATTTTGDPADIVAATTGDVLHLGATQLQWGQIGTASFQDASVTAAKIGTDVVLDTLNDVAITSAASRNFLRFDATTSHWKNYDLGPIGYELPAASIPVLALDGGSTLGSALIAGLGAHGSRLLLHYSAGGPAVNTALDFVLSGEADDANEKVARIRTVSASEVGFYDQGTSTITAGDKVLSWMCNASVASRSFRFHVPLDVTDSSGGSYLRIAAASTAEWDLKTAAGAKFFSFHTTGSLYGFNLTRAENAIDLNGKLLYMTGATGASPYISGSSGQMNIRVGTSGILELAPDTTSSVRVGASGSTISFFGSIGTTRVAVTAPAAITAVGGADATYSANEQTLLNALTADVVALRLCLNNLRNALNGYNLV